MRNCSNCQFYCAIDPSVGNCRVNGSSRAKLRGVRSNDTCDSQAMVANDNQPAWKVA